MPTGGRILTLYLRISSQVLYHCATATATVYYLIDAIVILLLLIIVLAYRPASLKLLLLMKHLILL